MVQRETHPLIQRLQASLQQTGLSGIAQTFGEAMRPLSPLAAQVLWIAQPTFGLFGEADSIGSLAQWLEHSDADLPSLPHTQGD